MPINPLKDTRVQAHPCNEVFPAKRKSPVGFETKIVPLIYFLFGKKEAIKNKMKFSPKIFISWIHVVVLMVTLVVPSVQSFSINNNNRKYSSFILVR